MRVKPKTSSRCVDRSTRVSVNVTDSNDIEIENRPPVPVKKQKIGDKYK